MLRRNENAGFTECSAPARFHVPLIVAKKDANKELY